MGSEEVEAVSAQYFFEKFSCERRVEGGMEAQEKAEWRKDVLGGGSTWMKASVKEPVQRKQEEMFHGGGCMRPRKRKVPTSTATRGNEQKGKRQQMF